MKEKHLKVNDVNWKWIMRLKLSWEMASVDDVITEIRKRLRSRPEQRPTGVK